MQKSKTIKKPDIQMQDRYWQMVCSVLQTHLQSDDQVWVFGSRATHTAKTYSDVDIAIDLQNPKTLQKLVDDFEQSPLPWKVDLVPIQSIDPAFLQKIQGHWIGVDLGTKHK